MDFLIPIFFGIAIISLFSALPIGEKKAPPNPENVKFWKQLVWVIIFIAIILIIQSYMFHNS